MTTTQYVDGQPSWIDLGTPDIEAAAAFYRGLLGWSFEAGGPEVGGYGMFRLDGKVVAGGMQVPPEQGPPAWGVYFQTSDAERTTAKVEESGGAVRVKPMQVMDQGSMAIYADPSGAQFGVWQPAANKGLEETMDVGSMVWTELYAGDVTEAKRFYGAVFGWGVSDTEMPGGSVYSMVRPAGTEESSMFGGIVSVDMDAHASGPYWQPYFTVEDADAIVARTEALGGTVRGAAADVPDVGRIAQLADAHGARFAVIKPLPRQ
ncbi:VOC family protein [Streptomyces sp. NPDC058045]|uniref:VOC family protein n=1 Tax=Streptomyces sp. NPDC058045 TaxID=3346311 RepID=UPI0036E7B122